MGKALAKEEHPVKVVSQLQGGMEK